MDELLRTTMRVPKLTHQKMKILAAVHGISLTDLIVDLVEKEAKRLGLDKLKLDAGN